MLACRSHSDRQKSNGGQKKRMCDPSRDGARERGLTSPVRWEPIPSISSAICPQLCTTPTPPFLPSWRLSADCLALSLLIRPIALCRRHAPHLSYHCLDNSLLVQKSLRARRSHDDDMVTLPGGFEPPAEIAYPFSSTYVCLPLCSSLRFPLASPFVGSPPPSPGAQNSLRGCVWLCVSLYIYSGRWDILLPKVCCPVSPRSNK